MNIILKKLHMENFKVFQKKAIDLSMLTKIFAQNYKGKSSIVDAFNWVLFGKSSTGNSEGKQFHPRRYDKDGVDINHVDIVVELLLNVDGKDILIRKTQKQNWVRKRGTDFDSYEGDKNLYEWNEVTVSETEHKKRVAKIIDEEVFKVITNPHAFTGKKQDDQRKFLVDNIAKITNEDVFQIDSKFAELRELTIKNSLEEIKAINKKALAGYVDEQKSIPIRIDEKSKEILDIDFAEQELALSALKQQLTDVENQILDTSKGYETVNTLKSEIAQIKGKIDDIERSEKAKLDDVKRLEESKINELKNSLWKVNSNIESTKESISQKKKFIQRNKEFLAESKRQYTVVRDEIGKIELEEFNEHDLNCPTCKQLLPADKQETIRANYDTDKQKRITNKQKQLDSVIEQGNLFDESIKADTSKVNELEETLKVYEADKEELDKQVADAKAEVEKFPSEVDLSTIEERKPLIATLGVLNVKLESAINQTKDIDTLKETLTTQKKSIQEQIQVVNGVLATKKLIDDAKDRVDELREKLKEATQKVANCERLEDLLESFEKAKMNLLSERINQKFKLVKWQLFRPQKNGGIENVCVCMVHGSPYGENTTSTTERLMAGLDIISTLQEIYDTKAPIFVDNAESYNDFNIPSMDCQMVLIKVAEPIYEYVVDIDGNKAVDADGNYIISKVIYDGSLKVVNG